MSTEISETRASLNLFIPQECNCVEINYLAHELDQAVSRGQMDTAEAVSHFVEWIDFDCPGKVEGRDTCIDGCGVKSEICGHVKGGKYLTAMMMTVRDDS